MAAPDAVGPSGNLDPGRERTRAGIDAGAGRGPYRYRRDVHAAEPARPQGRAIIRGATDPGVDRSAQRPGPAARLCLCRLGPEILSPPQRDLPEFCRTV